MILPVTWVHSTLLLVILTVHSLFSPGTIAGTQSKTYSFTSTAAFNYDITGPITFTASQATVSWYNNAWQYRRKITINKDQIGETLTDFPVLIRLAGTDVYSHARDDGFDLLFTSSDGVTKLAHEREDTTHIWVKVPKLTSVEDTTLYLYYGNPSATDQQNPTQVWTNGYKAVWHMAQSPTSTQEDVTANTNDAVPVNIDAQDGRAEGKIGQAVHFTESSGDYMAVNEDDLATDYITVSSWFNVAPWTTNFPDIISRRNPITDSGSFTVELSSISGHLWWTITANGVTPGDTTSGWPVGEWVHFTGTFDGEHKRVYRNGSAVGTPVQQSGTIDNPAGQVTEIGRNPFSIPPFPNEIFLNGSIDHTTVSSVARSPAWIRAEYLNQCDCEQFLSISGAVESLANSPTITLKSDRPLSFASLNSFTVNGSTTLTFQLSNDAGKTWYFSTNGVWKGATPANSTHTSSAQVITDHLSTFPVGSGKLLWKAFLTSPATLESITTTYTGGTPTSSASVAASSPITSLDHPVVVSINSLFRMVFTREIVFDEWLYWTNRLLAGEKTTLPELFGAMQWQELFGDDQ